MQELLPVSDELRAMLKVAEPEIQHYVLGLQAKVTQLLAHNGKLEVDLGVFKHKLKHYEPLERLLDRFSKFDGLTTAEKKDLHGELTTLRAEMKKPI